AAIDELLSVEDFEVILRLATEAESPRWVGFAFGEAKGDASEVDNILQRTLGDPNRKIREFALEAYPSRCSKKRATSGRQPYSEGRDVRSGVRKTFWTCCSPYL